MSRTTRCFLIALLAGIVLFAAGLSLAVAAVYRSGSIAVELRQRDGDSIRVGVPAGLARVAIALAPRGLAREAAREAQPFLAAARAGWDGLASAPDFVLFELESPGELVSVEKKDGALLVRVDGPEASVRIRVPTSTVGSLLAKLDEDRIRG